MEDALGVGLEPKKLGPAFWVMWIAGFAACLAGYVGLLYWMAFPGEWSSWVAVAATIVFTLLIMALAVLPGVLKRRSGGVPPVRLPMRRYMARFFIAMLAYSIGLTLAMETYRSAKPTGVLAWVIAALPAAGIILVIRAVLLLMKEEDDEFQKVMHVQAFVLAAGGMMAVCTLWGFVEMFGLLPHLEMWWVFPIWAMCLFPAQLVTRWRFR